MVSKQVPLITHVPYLISVKCTNISLYFYASPTQNLASPVKRIHPNYCHMDYSTPTLSIVNRCGIYKKNHLSFENIMVYLHLVWHSFSWLKKLCFFLNFAYRKCRQLKNEKYQTYVNMVKDILEKMLTFKIYFLLKDLSPYSQ